MRSGQAGGGRGGAGDAGGGPADPAVPRGPPGRVRPPPLPPAKVAEGAEGGPRRAHRAPPRTAFPAAQSSTGPGRARPVARSGTCPPPDARARLVRTAAPSAGVSPCGILRARAPGSEGDWKRGWARICTARSLAKPLPGSALWLLVAVACHCPARAPGGGQVQRDLVAGPLPVAAPPVPQGPLPPGPQPPPPMLPLQPAPHIPQPPLSKLAVD